MLIESLHTVKERETHSKREREEKKKERKANRNVIPLTEKPKKKNCPHFTHMRKQSALTHTITLLQPFFLFS